MCMASQQPTTESVNLEELVANAANDYPTVDQLTGNEKYYPDASAIFEWPHRINEETLQYLVLLTKGDNYTASSLKSDYKTKHNGIGSLIFTDRAIYYATTEDEFHEFPYDTITRVRGDADSEITLYLNDVEHQFEMAYRAEEENVTEAYAYLREQVYTN